MAGGTIDLPNTSALGHVDVSGKLVIERDGIYIEDAEGVSMALATLLRTGYGADDALGAAMALQEGVPATEARIGLGQVSITVTFEATE